MGLIYISQSSSMFDFQGNIALEQCFLKNKNVSLLKRSEAINDNDQAILLRWDGNGDWDEAEEAKLFMC